MPVVSQYIATVVDCPDPRRLAAFYQALTGWVVTYENDDEVVAIGPGDGRFPDISFQRVDGYTPPSVAGVLEFAMPYAVPERTVVASHPACGCTTGTGRGTSGRETAAPGSVSANVKVLAFALPDSISWTADSALKGELNDGI